MGINIEDYPILLFKYDGDWIAMPVDFKGYVLGDGKTPNKALKHLKQAVLEWEDLAEKRGMEKTKSYSTPLEALSLVLAELGMNRLSKVEIPTAKGTKING
ncbi:hypothetical protein [Candidatus Liberibacter sp.]|uniref:hypothetical protein n=1 Tax=Candidatus Liberibacter sp. TaxID=34022 RepID=UPI0015F4D5D5|nr:hypothetical protein [Candidatus Liberibacter sp.]MBA5724614.1 hypothetical protein [Candidatus Liberibacter sp.]